MFKKFLLTSLLLLLPLQICFAAITRGATITNWLYSETTTNVSQSHTVNANTTLLIVAITMEADETLSTPPSWDGNAMTLIGNTTSSGLSGDEKVFIYGLINPTAKAGNVTYTQSSDDHGHFTAVNYLGTETSSVANAAKYVSEKVNDSAATTTAIPSGGTTGATLFACAVFYGGDGDPATDTAGWDDGICNSATGISTSADVSVYVGDYIGGAAAGNTVDWVSTASDENAGIIIQIWTPALYQASLISSLTDNFDDDSIDGAKWNDEGWGQIVETNQQLELTTTTGSGDWWIYSGIYDLTGSSTTIKLVDAGNQGLATFSVFPLSIFLPDYSHHCAWEVKGGNIYAEIDYTGGGETHDTYVANSFRYLKIREASGTIYWDYSATGLDGSWVNFWSQSNPFVITGIEVIFELISSSEASPTTAIIDDFNILPSGGARRIIFIN